MSQTDFYDALAPVYHLIYPDWEGSMRRQGEALDAILRARASVADMREAFDHHRRTFDVVIACDNAVPHLLTDADILRAFEQLHRCTAPGGLCLISVRDYDAVERGGIQLHPHGVRQVGGTRWVLFQLWEWEGERYHTTMYVVEHAEGAEPVTRATRATYYAVRIATLADLLRRAGFAEVERIDGGFFQPVLVGRRAR